jgi:hypothetical protein
MRFLEHDECSEECYKANKCDKMAYETRVIQYFFYFAPILYFKFKKSSKHNARKIIFGKYKGLATLVTRRIIQVLNLNCQIIA